LLLFQHVTYGSAGGSSNNISSDAERNFFVELWDVSGHERYKACRSLFYTQINGKSCFSLNYQRFPALYLCTHQGMSLPVFYSISKLIYFSYYLTQKKKKFKGRISYYILQLLIHKS
jgi:hypothetical protein